jgi:hypothetical protein
LIEHFSEDIDIVIGRDSLGFGGDESPENAPSIKQRKNRLAELKKTCKTCIHSELKPAIEQLFTEALPSGTKWSLNIAPPEEDPEEQTLLFSYPGTLTGISIYLRPLVKIELGARSDTWPTESPFIKPFLLRRFRIFLPKMNFRSRQSLRKELFGKRLCCCMRKPFDLLISPKKHVLRGIIMTCGVLSKKVSLIKRKKIPIYLQVQSNIAPIFFSNKVG